MPAVCSYVFRPVENGLHFICIARYSEHAMHMCVRRCRAGPPLLACVLGEGMGIECKRIRKT